MKELSMKEFEAQQKIEALEACGLEEFKSFEEVEREINVIIAIREKIKLLRPQDYETLEEIVNLVKEFDARIWILGEHIHDARERVYYMIINRDKQMDDPGF